MAYVLRYTLTQSKEIGKNAAIILNLIADMGDGVSTRTLSANSGLSDKSVTSALKALRVVKLLHPNRLILTELGVKCSKSTTERSKNTTPAKPSESPVTVDVSAQNPEILKGEGGTIGGLGIESSNLGVSIELTNRGKEINQLGEPKKDLVKSNTPPTLQQVLDYFEERNQPAHKAREMWNYYTRLMKETGGRVWKDTNGNTIKSWKRKAVGVWFGKEKQKHDRYAGHG